MNNPYLKNKEAISGVLASAERTTKGWRSVSLINAVATVIAVAGVVYIGSQSKIIPVAIEVNGEGTPTKIYKANAGAIENEDMVTRAALGSAINAVFGVSVDASLQKKRMARAVFFFAEREPGFQKVRDYFQDPETNPFRRAKKELVEIKLKNIIKLTPSTWQVEWTEIVRERSGKLVEKNAMKGTASVKKGDEVTEQSLYVNPTAILITDLVWSKEI